MQSHMLIETEQDMIEFCESTRGPFNIRIKANLSLLEELGWMKKNVEMIQEGKIGKGSPPTARDTCYRL